MGGVWSTLNPQQLSFIIGFKQVHSAFKIESTCSSQILQQARSATYLCFKHIPSIFHGSCMQYLLRVLMIVVVGSCRFISSSLSHPPPFLSPGSRDTDRELMQDLISGNLYWYFNLNTTYHVNIYVKYQYLYMSIYIIVAERAKRV